MRHAQLRFLTGIKTKRVAYEKCYAKIVDDPPKNTPAKQLRP